MFFRRQLKAEATQPIPRDDPDTKAKEIDIMARTLWGEARGETLTGKEAVANVILNRLKLSRRRGKMWWGNSIEEICLKPSQFSCWNKGDPNYPKLSTIDQSDPQFAICQRVATRAVNGMLPDHVFGADHYHTTSILPHWAESRASLVTIGHHVFYQLEK